MLGSTLVLWVGSSIVLQAIFGGPEQYRQPVFVTLLNSAVGVSLLIPRPSWSVGKKGVGGADDIGEVAGENGCKPTVPPAGLRSVVPLSATVGSLWLCSQWIFNVSLLHTSVATNTVISSSSSVFTFIFSLLIYKDPFRWLSCSAAAFSFLGCAVVALQSPRNMSSSAVTNSTFGDGLAFTAAALFALVSVLLRRLAPEGFDLGSFMGLNGLLSVGVSPVLLYAAHTSGIEPFKPPSPNTLACLAANALIGCTLANYLYTSALLLLSPLVANVCLSFSIPLSAFVDEVLLQQHQFSVGWAVGASLVAASVVCAALDLETNDGTDDAKIREAAQPTELESLLEGHVDDDSESLGLGRQVGADIMSEDPGGRRRSGRSSADA